ncbi:MAG: GreA/GreB family elongation factor [Puniceicoccales bacterium]|jgi:transcription elongation GreA/GreB family factor|nr:GreA/GreB family elongation factor [Puniceicoccales bacterium]
MWPKKTLTIFLADSVLLLLGGLPENMTMDTAVIETLLLENPLLQRYRDKLTLLRTGACCYHRTFGYGQIASYGADSGKLIINFLDKPGHAIDLAFALKHLEFIPAEHLIARYRENAEETEKLLKNDPLAAIEIILEHMPDRRATQFEITELISVIWDKKNVRAWWTRAHKSMELSAKVSVPEVKTGYYILRDQPLEQLDEVIDGVLMSKQSAQKVAYAERLLKDGINSDRAEDLRLVMEEMQRISASPAAPVLCRLLAFWVCEDLSTIAPAATSQSVDVLQEAFGDVGVILKTADMLSAIKIGRFLKTITELHPEKFHTIIDQLICNGSQRTIGSVINSRMSDGKSEELRQMLFQGLRDNSLKINFLEWVFRNYANAKYRDIFKDGISAAHLRMALVLIDQEATRRQANRKIALAELIVNDKDLVEKAVRGETMEIARDLVHMIMLSQGFDLLAKRSIVARVVRVFPDLQGLLASGDGTTVEAKHADNSSGIMYVSQKSLDAIRREYEILINEKIPDNKRAIEIAREIGDLRENSEYKMARQDQGVLMARKAQIERDLVRIQVIDFQNVQIATVSIGTVATLGNGQGKLQKFAILGAWDSDPQRSIVAYQTPIGAALLGKKVGDVVKLAGREEQKVIAIERWTEHA